MIGDMPQNLHPFQAGKSMPAGRTLVFAPHPDDEVFGCGGAIIKHVQQGDQVKIVIVTDGGFPVNQTQKIAGNYYTISRKKESQAAALVLGYGEPEFLDYPDNELICNEELIGRLLRIIEKTNPDNIYLPSKSEVHPDHSSVSNAVTEAVRRFKAIVNLLYYEIGHMQTANFLLDITSVNDQIIEAFNCFESQLAVQDYDRHINALHSFRTYTLGKEVKFAEAYQIISSKTLKTGSELWQLNPLTDAPRINENPPLTNQPLISMIVRTINRHELPEALVSISNQTYTNLEVIVVDAKGDGNLKLGDFCGNFPIRLISKNKALSRPEAANAGLEAVKGEYFSFLDEDDLLLPGHIENLIPELSSSTALAAYSIVERVNDHMEKEYTYNQEFNFGKLLWENYIPNMALLFRSEVIRKGCLFDTGFSVYEDWDFVLQVAMLGNLRFVEKSGGIYRNFNTSEVHSYGYGNTHFRKKIYEKWIKKVSEIQFDSFLNVIQKTPKGHEPAYFAQLFPAKYGSIFSEKDSLRISIFKETSQLVFKLLHPVNVKMLRFDPINDYALIKFDSIRLFSGGRQINEDISFTSNALTVDGNIHLFHTVDSQVFIAVENEAGSMIDEVQVELQYQQTGNETIPGIVDTLHSMNNDLRLKAENLEIKNLQHIKEIEALQNKVQETLSQYEASLWTLETTRTEFRLLRHSQPFKLSEKIGLFVMIFKPRKLIETIRDMQDINKTVRQIHDSDLFDTDFYLENNPVVRSIRIKPEKHYLLYGGFEGRNPSPGFDSAFYLREYPDVKSSGMNPLVHYLLFGKKEGRKPLR